MLSDQTELQPADSQQEHICVEAFVHNKDVEDPEETCRTYQPPDVAILSYPVITSGKYAHRDSFVTVWKKSRQSRNWTICRWKIM